MTGCVNGHTADAIEIRPNGARVCTDCRDQFQRRNRVTGRGTGSTPIRSAAMRRDARKATTHARHNN